MQTLTTVNGDVCLFKNKKLISLVSPHNVTGNHSVNKSLYWANVFKKKILSHNNTQS